MPLNTFANRTSSLPLSELDANFTFVSDSTNLSFLQSGTGAVSRTVQAKERDIVSVKDFGAVGDGVTDDSAAFVLAFAANLSVQGDSGAIYKIKDITLTNSQVFNGNGCRLTSATGAAYLFKLTNFAAIVQNVYVSDASTCSEAAIVFDNGRFCGFFDSVIINATTAFRLKATVAATGCIKPRIGRVQVQTISGKGIDLGPNVTQLEATDVFLDGAATHGVSHVSTGSVIGAGGHTYTNVRAEGSVIGWLLTDAELTEINGGWADNTSGVGFKVTGASSHINVNDFYVGTTTGGISIENTSVVYINGLETFGASDTVNVLNTATLIMNVAGWRGSKASLSVASGATLTVTGATQLFSSSNGTVTASTTVYMGANGAQASENDTGWRAPDNGYLIGVYALATVTPVTTHVYTARANAGDTALVATMNAGEFAATVWGAVSVTKGQLIDVKVATSTTNAARHQIVLVFCPL